jgi:hypothetical protein
MYNKKVNMFDCFIFLLHTKHHNLKLVSSVFFFFGYNLFLKSGEISIHKTKLMKMKGHHNLKLVSSVFFFFGYNLFLKSGEINIHKTKLMKMKGYVHSNKTNPYP